jgi:hypothetical protein
MQLVSTGMQLTAQDMPTVLARGTSQSTFQHEFSVNIRCGLISELLIGSLVLEPSTLPEEGIGVFNEERVFADNAKDVLSPRWGGGGILWSPDSALRKSVDWSHWQSISPRLTQLNFILWVLQQARST